MHDVLSWCAQDRTGTYRSGGRGGQQSNAPPAAMSTRARQIRLPITLDPSVMADVVDADNTEQRPRNYDRCMSRVSTAWLLEGRRRAGRQRFAGPLVQARDGSSSGAPGYWRCALAKTPRLSLASGST